MKTKENSGRLIVMALAFLALVSVAVSCSDDNEAKKAKLEIRLTDAPGDFEEVNIDIQGLEFHQSSGEQSSGWQSLPIQTGVYNLLDLRNGLDTLLGTFELRSGRISQIRLILGDDNTLKVGGEMFDLGTPSGQSSGLKLNVQANLAAGVTYKMLLDFDAALSIVTTGNGGFKLKPVIRVITEATSGAIDGTLSIPQAGGAVYAVADEDTVAAAFTDVSTGKFLLRGVPAGTYEVRFAPAEGFSIDAINDVVVVNGQVTHLEEVTVND
jgi:hypothetical protein